MGLETIGLLIIESVRVETPHSEYLTTNTPLPLQINHTVTHRRQLRQRDPTLLLHHMRHCLRLCLAHNHHLPTVVKHHQHTTLRLQRLQSTHHLLTLTPTPTTHLARHSQLARHLVQQISGFNHTRTGYKYRGHDNLF